MKTLREARQGKTLLRLVGQSGRFAGVAITGNIMSARIDGTDAEAVWAQLLSEAGKANPGYIGYDEARACFLRWFPDGFGSADYQSAERTYKVSARERLLEEAPLEEVATGTGYGEAAIRAFNRTNLVFMVEKARIRDVLRSSDADAFLQAAAAFTLEPDAAPLAAMERILRSHDAARWSIVTYLPFLWRPEANMYLKPQVTTDFATRTGHAFAHAYASDLEIDVYRSLLDLAETAEREIAELVPRDRIDVQSFIWVVGEYKPGDGAEIG